MEAEIQTKIYKRKSDHIHLRAQDSYGRMLYEVFILSLILTWFPSKALSYAAPYIIMVYTFVVYKHYEITLNYIKITAIIILFVILNYLFRSEYIFSNGVLTTITYSSFLVLWALPNKKISPRYLGKIYKAIYFTVAFQSCFGLFQFLIALLKFGSYTVDMGDFIQGTIVPFSFNLEGDRGIGNAYFVINILIMILFILIDDNKNKISYIILCLGIISSILAGVHHILISIFLALFLALCITNLKKALRYLFIIVPTIVLALAIFYFLNPNNVYLYAHYFTLYSTGESFKTIAMKSALMDLYDDHPIVSLLGTGLGQFSSRAGLIASGTYLGGLDENRSILFFPIAKSIYFKNYAFEVYYAMKMDKSTTHGAASRTFFSLMSIYVELGILFFTCIIFYIISAFFKMKKSYNFYNKINANKSRDIIVVLIASILFFMFISFFDNYLEMSQCTLTCFILLRIFYNNTTLSV